MGDVVAFGLPPLRARRKPTSGFCEVTIMPARTTETRDLAPPSQSPKRRAPRKPNGPPRPAGVGLK